MSPSLPGALAMLSPYILLFGLGAWWALFPDRPARRAARRMAAGDDRFLDEQRSLKAYARHREPRIVRWKGIGLMIVAFFMAALRYVELTSL